MANATHTTGHFLSHLGQARSLDEVVEFTQRRVPGKTLDVPEEVLGLRLKQPPEWGRQQAVSQSKPIMMIIIIINNIMDG